MKQSLWILAAFLLACGSKSAGTCSVDTCSGCCDPATGSCYPGNTADHCGVAGDVCGACSGGATCQTGACLTQGCAPPSGTYTVNGMRTSLTGDGSFCTDPETFDVDFDGGTPTDQGCSATYSSDDCSIQMQCASGDCSSGPCYGVAINLALTNSDTGATQVGTMNLAWATADGGSICSAGYNVSMAVK